MSDRATLVEQQLSEAQQERDEARQMLTVLGAFDGCQSCGHSIVTHGYDCDYRDEDGAPCGCDEFMANLPQLIEQVTQQAATISQLREALEELCNGIEDGGGTDGNGDMFDLTNAIAALANVRSEEKP